MTRWPSCLVGTLAILFPGAAFGQGAAPKPNAPTEALPPLPAPPVAPPVTEPSIAPAAPVAPNSVEATPTGASRSESLPVESEVPREKRYGMQSLALIALGAHTRTLAGLSNVGPSLLLGYELLADGKTALDILIGYEYGRSRFGLTTHGVNLGATISHSVGAVRAGIGPLVAWHGVERATTGAVIGGVSIGAAIRLGVDFRLGDRTRFLLFGQADASWIFAFTRAPAAYPLGLSGMAGVTF
jgi:hypothetical protein